MKRSAPKRKPGRPRLGRVPRVPVLLRLDADVLTRLRHRAQERGIGYQTLINDTLAAYVAGAFRVAL